MSTFEHTARCDSVEGDYLVVNMSTGGLRAVIEGYRTRTSTGKLMSGANAARRKQAWKRRTTIAGIARSAFSFWRDKR